MMSYREKAEALANARVKMTEAKIAASGRNGFWDADDKLTMLPP